MAELRAIFFDFDGLMLDTEYACFAGWQAVFQGQGSEYRLEEFQQIVGTDQNPRALLEERAGRKLDWDTIENERREIETKFGLDLEIKPGVLELLKEARSNNWICAVVSSSPYYWIKSNLDRCDAMHYFDGFICRGDAPKAKPSPDLYLEALRQFNLGGDETVALEDSHNGSLASKRAGIWSVAIPNDITRAMDFSHCDLITESVEDLSYEILVERFK